MLTAHASAWGLPLRTRAKSTYLRSSQATLQLAVFFDGATSGKILMQLNGVLISFSSLDAMVNDSMVQ